MTSGEDVMNTLFRTAVLVSAFLPAVLAAQTSGSEEYEPYQQAVLNEVNFARTDPAGYAQKRLAADCAAGKDNGAYAQLMKTKPTHALSLEAKLTKAAAGYAKFLAAKNRFGHNERGTPASRISAETYAASAMGENIACGSFPGMNAEETPAEAAVIFVKQWIIDAGVPGAGHRRNILSPLFTETGIGFGSNPASSYVNYMVQDFGSPR